MLAVLIPFARTCLHENVLLVSSDSTMNVAHTNHWALKAPVRDAIIKYRSSRQHLHSHSAILRCGDEEFRLGFVWQIVSWLCSCDIKSLKLADQCRVTAEQCSTP